MYEFGLSDAIYQVHYFVSKQVSVTLKLVAICKSEEDIFKLEYEMPRIVQASYIIHYTQELDPHYRNLTTTTAAIGHQSCRMMYCRGKKYIQYSIVIWHNRKRRFCKGISKQTRVVLHTMDKERNQNVNDE